MKYIISYSNPHQHYIDIEFIADNINSDETIVQLPAWRPGRYELGNFAKNIQKWAVYDEKQQPLCFEKISKDAWKIYTKGRKAIHVKYNYFAFELNAGSTYLDELQLYVNPINCCIYMPERINEKCELQINIPVDYTIAIGALAPQPLSKGEGSYSKNISEKAYDFSNYHQLVDTPFIASNSLQHKTLEIENKTFHLWFQGKCTLDWEKLTNDFRKFCSYQLQMMGSFPTNDYHFLFQITPYKHYHGVEHITSTVIALGPADQLMQGDLYEDLLGVSCHELFHVWNVKTIRPAEMFPYDYSKENYSRQGYVYEGVTTYYGDLFLLRSGVFNEEQYFKTFNERLQKHFDNFGRFNLSVADSSFDTWLDGYVPGIPNRKTNIYDEGCLLAFITDIFIRKNSNNKHSLDDVMRYLNAEFALKNKGYTQNDYKFAIERFANASFDSIYSNYFFGTNDYEPLLIESLNYIGCELIKIPSAKSWESSLGIKIIELNGAFKISSVYPDSLADKAGLSINDELISINDMELKQSDAITRINDICSSNANILLIASSNFSIKKINITLTKELFYQTITAARKKQPNAQEVNNYRFWSI